LSPFTVFLAKDSDVYFGTTVGVIGVVVVDVVGTIGVGASFTSFEGTSTGAVTSSTVRLAIRFEDMEFLIGRI
jgi:hypothetical protein